MKMEFKVNLMSGKFEVAELKILRIINAGYTGRDQKAVWAHIDELREKGIPAPESTPTYFPKLVDRLTQAEEFEVLDRTDHSGEAEYALIFSGDKVYVGVGSDHTDRKLEAISIHKAKQIYVNTISRELWDLSDVEGHWDEIILRSWVKQEDKKILFQEATLDAMLPPADLISRVRGLLVDPSDTDGLVIYSGTVASLTKADCSDYFEVELDDQTLGRKLSQHYEMHPVREWFKSA
jgi:hypothetical protein